MKKWMETLRFRFICTFVLYLFLFQNIQPMTFGIPQPKKPWDFLGAKSVHAQEEDAFPPVIVVGQTLSTFLANKVENNQLTITYTVFNLQSEKVEDVLLMTTLESGVSFNSP